MAGYDEADDSKDPEPLCDEFNDPDEREIDDEDRHLDDHTCPEQFEDLDFNCGPDSEG